VPVTGTQLPAGGTRLKPEKLRRTTSGAFFLEGQAILHVVDRVSSHIVAILMPVGICLGIMQHGLVSGKTPAADMFTVNLFQLCLAHSHPITLTQKQL
jgi:hypothetical protein